MKKSQLKALIREVIEEALYSEKELAKKFFISTYELIKKKGKEKSLYRDAPGLYQKSWDGDRWTLDGGIDAWLHQNHDKMISSPGLEVSLLGNGNIVFHKGNLNNLKELLVSIS